MRSDCIDYAHMALGGDDEGEEERSNVNRVAFHDLEYRYREYNFLKNPCDEYKAGGFAFRIIENC
jgi:hypothetical protein